jgi:hypothetical protein
MHPKRPLPHTRARKPEARPLTFFARLDAAATSARSALASLASRPMSPASSAPCAAASRRSSTDRASRASSMSGGAWRCTPAATRQGTASRSDSAASSLTCGGGDGEVVLQQRLVVRTPDLHPPIPCKPLRSASSLPPRTAAAARDARPTCPRCSPVSPARCASSATRAACFSAFAAAADIAATSARSSPRRCSVAVPEAAREATCVVQGGATPVGPSPLCDRIE